MRFNLYDGVDDVGPVFDKRTPHRDSDHMTFIDREPAINLDVQIHRKLCTDVPGADRVGRLHTIDGERDLLDPPPITDRRCGIDQLVDGRTKYAPRCLEDQQTDNDCPDPVDNYPLGIDDRNRNRDRRRDLRDGVRTVVPGVGLEGRRAHLPPDLRSPPIEHFLDDDREHGRAESDGGGVALRFVAEPTNRLYPHTHRNRTDSDTDDYGDQGFNSPVTVWMVLIGGCRPVAHAEYHRDIGHRVGETVEGIGEDRLAVAKDPGRRLGGREQEVAEQTDPPNLAHP